MGSEEGGGVGCWEGEEKGAGDAAGKAGDGHCVVV